MEAWLKSLFISFLLLIVIFIFLNFSFIYLTPFIIAILLASLINPLVTRLEKSTGLERSLATFIILSVFIGIIFIFIFIGVFQIYLEIDRLLDKLPDYNQIREQINLIFQDDLRILPPSLERILKDNLQLLYNTLKDGLLYLANNLLNILSKLPLVLTVLVLSFIATYFITRDADKINDYIMGLFPGQYRGRIHRLEKELLSSALRFLRAELLLILITGMSSYLGFIIVGNDFALIIALTAALLDLIPVIGPGLLFIPWILFNMFSGNLFLALEILIIYTFVTAIRQGLEGKIIGAHLGIHPLLTMIGFYVGYRILGPIGFIIGPGTLVLGKAICNSGIFPNLISFKE